MKRKTTYRIYPSKKQNNKLLEILRLHQRLYNAALEQRIDAYRRCGVSLNLYAQSKDLTRLRGECSEYAALNAQSEQVTLRRLDLAFKHFFRRVKKGETPGFPRFKSFDRYKGWGYASYGDGWRLKLGPEFVGGTLNLSGVGNLQARGRSRFVDAAKTSRAPGAPKTLEILRKDGRWYASVTFETSRPYRQSGEAAWGLDWGVNKFLTAANEHKEVFVVENPRHLKKRETALRKAQRSLSRKRKGSRNRQKAKAKLVRLHERLSWKREEFLHQTSAKLVQSARLLATEELNIAAMTRSGGSHKRGLNRSILDTSPGKFFSLLAYKAEEAGIPYVEVPTKKVRPTQTCSDCGHAEKKQLWERLHDCKKCGLRLDRDVNSALVNLNYALKSRSGTGLGVEGASRPLKHETPSNPHTLRRACED